MLLVHLAYLARLIVLHACGRRAGLDQEIVGTQGTAEIAQRRNSAEDELLQAMGINEAGSAGTQ